MKVWIMVSCDEKNEKLFEGAYTSLDAAKREAHRLGGKTNEPRCLVMEMEAGISQDTFKLTKLHK